jgi:hypothetical protein
MLDAGLQPLVVTLRDGALDHDGPDAGPREEGDGTCHVVDVRPKGETAGRLWDGVLLCTGTEGFFELKRSRTARPSFD